MRERVLGSCKETPTKSPASNNVEWKRRSSLFTSNQNRTCHRITVCMHSGSVPWGLWAHCYDLHFLEAGPPPYHYAGLWENIRLKNLVLFMGDGIRRVYFTQLGTGRKRMFSSEYLQEWGETKPENQSQSRGIRVRLSPLIIFPILYLPLPPHSPLRPERTCHLLPRALRTTHSKPSSCLRVSSIVMTHTIPKTQP